MSLPPPPRARARARGSVLGLLALSLPLSLSLPPAVGWAGGCTGDPAGPADAWLGDVGDAGPVRDEATADSHLVDTDAAGVDTKGDTGDADTAGVDTKGDAGDADTAGVDTKGDTGDAGDAGDAADMGDAGASWGFDAFLAQYGVITTLAGRGAVGDKGVNGWDPAFEGGPAVDAELSRPHIALGDGAGRVYIADKDGHAVRRVDPDGRIWTVAGTGAPGDDGDAPGPATELRLSSPNGLWVAADGAVYILDLGNDKVRRLSVDGQLSTLFAIGGAGAGRGLWVADDASVAYVAAGTQLKRWTPAGGVVVLADGFVSLGNLALVPAGTPGPAGPDGDSAPWAGQLLVTDRGGSRVYRVDPLTGAKVVIAGTGTADDLPGGGDGGLALATGLDEVRGVWPHPQGGYLLACHKGDDVWFVAPDGTIHRFVEGKGGDTHAGDGLPVTAPGPKVSEPRAVTMDAAGNVLITENDLGFVRRVERLP